jgi:pyruvate formate lyase activating enzyme
MILAGLQKSTLIDYPGQIAAVVFLAGCNLRCRYCHNPEMVLPREIQQNTTEHIPEKLFWNFLERRRGILDGVSVCGGEPTIHRDLPDFCRRIQSLGYKIKLDTNGQNPAMLEKLLEEQLVDYVAMDIKHTWEEYPRLVGRPIDREKYQESIDIIMHRAPEYEFRSTLIGGIHTVSDIHSMAKSISGAQRYFLQNYRPGSVLDPDFS